MNEPLTPEDVEMLLARSDPDATLQRTASGSLVTSGPYADEPGSYVLISRRDLRDSPWFEDPDEPTAEELLGAAEWFAEAEPDIADAAIRRADADAVESDA